VEESRIIGEAAIKIDELEHQMDLLLHRSLGSLRLTTKQRSCESAAASTFEVMKIKEVYEYLQTTTDRAEDVSDMLRILMVKYPI
jgi:uncharacterized protein Yka (UPF0111/DUF47 family)